MLLNTCLALCRTVSPLESSLVADINKIVLREIGQCVNREEITIKSFSQESEQLLMIRLMAAQLTML